MKRIFVLALLVVGMGKAMAGNYIPTAENLESRKQFSDCRFGIFLHWGIYSMFAQGEWYLQSGPKQYEYAKAADAFYPHRFNALSWVRAIKDAGAKYICITSRHHDGFSMWGTKQSPYNIVDATPFGRDVLKELAEACQQEGIRLHFYYSHLDWGRDDYPMGRTGHEVGKDSTKADFQHYFKFMNAQLTELLTNYGPIGGIWFDGVWDHDNDATPFDWQLEEQYALIHKLQPACLVGNNHHKAVVSGEDFQMFERDLPGDNTAGWNKSEISALPLETCETMNGIWGYKITDQNYKSTQDIIRMLVNASGRDANLLMNLGPQPNGELPALGLQRLHEVGQWMKKYGDTIYGTRGGDLKPQEWGVTTRKGNQLYVHVLNQPGTTLSFPLKCKVKAAKLFIDGTSVPFKQKNGTLTLTLPEKVEEVDYVIALTTKE
ncbi:MAG: alpha-L-fucosidase [Bacteroidales bacterium]|nr:alpha-L-fucosidase [Bacteroidales bacterium]